MVNRILLILAAVLSAGTGGNAQMIATSQPSPLEAKTVPKFGVFEVGLTSGKQFANPFTDAKVSAEFTSPSGKKVAVDGFYYGGGQWRVRFVPREHGAWKYSAAFAAPAEANARQGEFECKGTDGHGFLRLSKRNPYRMEREDGTPFYPIGIQTGGLLDHGHDGPNPDGSWRNVSLAEWARDFDGAINLVRTQLGQGTAVGGAMALIPAPAKGQDPTTMPIDRYDTNLAAQMDEAFAVYRQHGFAQILILMQDMSLWGGVKTAFGGVKSLAQYKSLQAENLPAQEQYLRYVVARYGCYVDIWEIFNEDSYAPDDYLEHLAGVVRKADPYGRILTTNYWRPELKWADIITWHEYMGMPASEVDAHLAAAFARYKSFGKVVQNTEFGNQGQLSNVDPVKWRLAAWTAFMHETGMLWWSMSGGKVPAGRDKPGGNANAYIGPDTRQHFRVLAEFTRDLPIDLRPVEVGFSYKHGDIRPYALSNGKVGVVYVHHYADHAKEFQLEPKLLLQMGPGKFRVRWLDPETGKEVKAQEANTPQHYLSLSVPPLKVDLACRLDRLDEPDSRPAATTSAAALAPVTASKVEVWHAPAAPVMPAVAPAVEVPVGGK